MANREPFEEKAMLKRMAKLREDVSHAFSDVEYPGDENICETPDDWESSAWLERYRGQHWRSMNTNLFDFPDSPFPWFTPNAFVFYLPGFLTQMLSSLEGLTSQASETALSALSPPCDHLGSSSWRRFLARVEQLSSRQRETIRNVYLFLLNDTPFAHLVDASAFARYWKDLMPQV